MERVQKKTGLYWALFFISLIGMMLLMLSPWGQWFWLILPVVCTTFALAMDLI